MQEKNIILYEEGAGSFLQGTEKKAVFGGTIVAQDGIVGDNPLVFLDPQSIENNPFLKHGQIFYTNALSIDLVIAQQLKPIWGSTERIAAVSPEAFDGKFLISKIILHNIYYAFASTKEMVSGDVEEYFKRHISQALNKAILTSMLYGEGKDGLLGLLHESQQVPFIKIKKNDKNDLEILKSMITLYGTQREKNQISPGSIWLMRPNFYSNYCEEILAKSGKLADTTKKFMGMEVYELSDLHMGHDCILLDPGCVFIASNKQIEMVKHEKLFLVHMGAQTKIGIIFDQPKKFAAGLSIQ